MKDARARPRARAALSSVGCASCGAQAAPWLPAPRADRACARHFARASVGARACGRLRGPLVPPARRVARAHGRHVPVGPPQPSHARAACRMRPAHGGGRARAAVFVRRAGRRPLRSAGRRRGRGRGSRARSGGQLRPGAPTGDPVCAADAHSAAQGARARWARWFGLPQRRAERGVVYAGGVERALAPQQQLQ